jgi:hypothetical protein
MSVITAILGFFVGLFNAAKKQWIKLEALEQTTATYASGLIAIINKDLTQIPDEFWAVVQANFPALTKDQVTAWMNSAVKFLDIANADASLSFEDALAALQAYLSKHTGNAWIVATQGLVGVFLTVISPNISDIQKITSIMEYIYLDIVKPLIHGVAPALTNTAADETAKTA